jgi:competence protein ComEC
MTDGKSFLAVKYPDLMPVTKPWSILSWVDRLRGDAIGILNRRLNNVYAGLLAGIVLGAKQDMPDDVTSSLQTAGVMHVIAASGMNVSMVAGALLLLLQGVVDRRKALWLSMAGVLFYVFLAGFEPSIVRAGFMAVIVFIGTLLGRQKVSLYTLLLVASWMVLISPQLILDIGFQLSVFATAGILVLQPLFHSVIKGKWKLLFHADITTTLAAQIATLPILLSNFGSINLLSVFINALVLWTVPILMTLGGVGVMVGLIYEPLSVPFLYSSIPFVWYFLSVVTILSRYPVALSFEVFPGSLTVGYYFVLTAFVVALRQKQRSKRNTTGNGERVGN